MNVQNRESGPPSNILHQRAHPHAQRLGNAPQGNQRHMLLAALDPADVIGVEVGLV